jgi:hypothetical protein
MPSQASNGVTEFSLSKEDREEFKKNGVVVLMHNCTPEDAKQNSLPTNSFLVEYQVTEKSSYDIVQSQTMSKAFDQYYDKFGSVIKSITYTQGGVNPRNYGVRKPVQPKQKKRGLAG